MINILIFNCADSELSITIVWPNDRPEKAIPNTRTTKTKLPLPYSFLIIKVQFDVVKFILLYIVSKIHQLNKLIKGENEA